MKSVFIIFLLLAVFNENITSQKLSNTAITSTKLHHYDPWSYCSYHNTLYYPRHIIKLRELFDDQKAASRLYHNLCGFENFQLNKVASLTNDTTVTNRGVSLLLGSIFSKASTLWSSTAAAKAKERKVNFDLPGQVAYHLPEEDSEEVITFRVVIRFDASSLGLFQNFTAKVPLLFAGESFELQLTPSQKEYLLPTTFRFNKTLAAYAKNSSQKAVHSISSNQTSVKNTGTHFPAEILPYIHSSYYLVCTNVFRYEFACLIDVKEGTGKKGHCKKI